MNGREARSLRSCAWAALLLGACSKTPESPIAKTHPNPTQRYEITVEDPVYLTAPATLTQQWDHRPDLEFSQDPPGCDANEAARYKSSVPK